MIIEQIEPVGVGALELALRQLREKLGKEGLFAPERKRPLPKFARRIAVVTSPTGAVIRDFANVAKRRFSGAQLLVIPTKVQGGESAPFIAAAAMRPGATYAR